MAPEAYLMGIDAGTSKIKAVIFDVEGNEIAVWAKDNAIIHENTNWMQQDMNIVWDNTLECIRGVIGKAGIDPARIKAVGVAGQGEGCWLIDENGQPARKAILWSDARAADIVRNIKNRPQLYNTICSITGSHPFPGATAMILKWLSENEPDIVQQARYCVFCKDWIRFKLTSKIAMEITDASTSLLDLKSGEVSRKMFRLLKIEQYVGLFPPVLRPQQLAGTITEAAARLTGLSENTIVCAGLMDIVAAALGIGAVSKGDICTILGTTCCNEVVTDGFNWDPADLSGYEIHALEGLYLNVMASMAGTPNLDWIMKTIFEKDEYKIWEREMAKIHPGCDGVVYHPYISTSGERAPFYNPDATASFFGISSRTGKYHLVRAVYEGVAFSIKDCLAKTPDTGRIFLSGGGAKSDFWSQIIADCTGREVILPDGEEFAAKGCAMAAAVAGGLYRDILEAGCKSLKVKKRFIPNRENTKVYEKFFEFYKQVRLAHNDLWHYQKRILDNIDQ